MKTIYLRSLIFLLLFLFLTTQAWTANVLNSDSDFSVKIAVTINGDDHIMGKLEYSNQSPQYPLQLVTFNPVGGLIQVEPYLFKIIERTIISKNVHRIKCTSINDKYGAGSLLVGTIDFQDELKPKVRLVNEGGYTYLGNLTEKGKEIHKKYIPNIWLGH